MLFTGVAFSITAFPVLCRILKELKLLNTTVGVVVLSAGVANDVGEFFFGFMVSDCNRGCTELVSGLGATCPERCARQCEFESDGVVDMFNMRSVDNIHALPH